MHYIADLFGKRFLLDALAYNQAIERLQPGKGYIFNEEQDQPNLAPEMITYKGVEQKVAANLYNIWLLQRAQCYYQSLEGDIQDHVRQVFGDGIASELLAVPVAARIERINNRLVVA